MSDRGESAYPRPLRKAEADLLSKRPTWREGKDVGFALSGGGIRSATFCLGLFQALARHGLLKRIDYLSTVSGGGYFGSFLGLLFARDHVKDPQEVLAGRERPAPDPLRWLRENGRYLAPNGAGDLLLAGAILFRNWLALMVVVSTSSLSLLLGLQLLRAFAARRLGATYDTWVAWHQVLPLGNRLWWSPWTLIVVPLALAWVLPLAWAYWVFRSRRADDGASIDGVNVGGPLFVLALGFLLVWWGPLAWAGPGLVLALVAGSTLVWTLVAALLSRWVEVRKESHGIFGLIWRCLRDTRLDPTPEVRNRLSRWLKWALIWTGALLAYALVDTLGWSAYRVLYEQREFQLWAWLAGLLGALGSVAGFANRAVVLFGGTGRGARPRVPVSAAAALGAGVLVLGAFLSLDTLAIGFARGFVRPPDVGVSLPPQPGERKLDVLVKGECPCPAATAVVGGPERSLHLSLAVPPPPPSLPPRAVPHEADAIPALLWGLAGAGMFSLLSGRNLSFLNRSSQHPFYASRLARAYLGATNSKRGDTSQPAASQLVTVVPGDDISLKEYRERACEKGAPLHLINVTINETLDGASQVQQQDRKGLGLAVGPCGMSAGARHHVSWSSEDWCVPGTGFRVFSGAKPEPASFPGEALTLGQWAAVSGAAFSTGLGSRTSLGLSLLAGLGNVRLGYWWDSGVDRKDAVGSRVGRWLGSLLPVQMRLLDEFTARFHGTARRLWYLSDGGHFENLGAYELIRRRLPLIVVVDAEADPDYTLSGLANLVRKARLDFGAEISFLGEGDLPDAVDRAVLKCFGSLDQLRRGRWHQEPVEDPSRGGGRRSVKPDRRRLSLAHASLARVTYTDPPAESRLLYIKATLTGDEPADVWQYHADHDDFPHETTADQFFDEVQWESYRRLGDHIGEKLFGPEAQEGRWVPHNLVG